MRNDAKNRAGAAVMAAAIAMSAIAAGCQEQAVEVEVPPEPEASVNLRIVGAAYEQDVRNAIIAERAIYSHHFAPGAAALNSLGVHRVEVLAEAYRAEPVQISVSAGDAPAELYERRQQAVRDALVAHGLDASKLTIGAAMSGGPGVRSGDAAQLFEWITTPVGTDNALIGGPCAPASGGSSGYGANGSSNMSGSSSNGGSR